MTESSKTKISGTGSQQLYVGDFGALVEIGGAKVDNANTVLYLDKNTEVAYTAHTGTTDVLKMTKWQLWLEQTNGTAHVDMKNATIITDSDDIVMLEQNNQIYSKIYALQWDVLVETRVGKYMLKAWNQMMISASDLANPSLNLSSLAGNIDEGITESTLFTKHGGKEILQRNTMSTNTGSATLGSGSSLSWVTTSGKYVEIIDPKDGSIAPKATINIQWNILSQEVKRITFNEKEAVISPVNSNFTFADIDVSGETNNIVYKAYNGSNTIIEKWVVTVFWSKQAAQNANKLVPNSSPVSSKDFRIISPVGNPYVTNYNSIKVEGSVPKDTVSYILVNNYRLQKYIPNTTTWYYYANTATDTLKDGINLYTIKFFWPGDKLLYTQLFTIIKDAPKAVSGETSR